MTYTVPHIYLYVCIVMCAAALSILYLMIRNVENQIGDCFRFHIEKGEPLSDNAYLRTCDPEKIKSMFG